MPTICKISLDASEYRAELARVVAESKAAAAEMSRAVSPASGNPSDRFDRSDRSDVAISVTADTAKAEAALSVFAETAGQTEATVSVDAAPTGTLEQTKRLASESSEGIVQAGRDVDELSKKVIDVPVQKFSDNAKKAFSDFRQSLFSGKKPLEQLREGILSMLNPWGLVMAAVGLVVAGVVKLYNHLTVSAAELAEQASIASESARRELDATRAKEQATQGYLSRLRELAVAGAADIGTKNETARLLDVLQSKYGDLGAVIDRQTGKCVNLLAVEKAINAERSREKAGRYADVADSAMKEAKAAYMSTGSSWYTTEWEAGKKFESMRKAMPLDTLIRMMDQKAQNATDSESIQGFAKVAEKLRSVVEARKKENRLRATGYETSEEETQKKLAAAQAAAAAETALSNAWDANAGQKIDQSMALTRGNEKKKKLWQNKIDAEEVRRAKIEGDSYAADAQAADAFKNSGADSEAYLNARARALKISEQLAASEAKISEYRHQQNLLDMQTAESKKKLADDADFERKSAELAAAGEMKKVEALKLEKELRDQNRKLTQKEKDAILEARAAVREQNYRSGIENQAAALYGQAMQNAGRGREWSEQSALRDARKQKGGELSGTDVEMVKKLAAISYRLEDKSGGRPGNFDIKTNELTARGGFATGVRVPEADKINREIANYNKSQVELLRQISDVCKNLGVFK